MNDKEYRLLDILASDNNATQREMSRATGFSIGMVNLVLKNLVKKGYIKVAQLNKRKLAYILTGKGFQEKTKKTYRYMKRVVRETNEMKTKIQAFIIAKYNEGIRTFYLQGDSDILALFELSAKELQLPDIDIRKDTPGSVKDAVLINCGDFDKRIKDALHISDILEQHY